MPIVPSLSAAEHMFPLTRLVLVVEHNLDFGTFLVQAIRQQAHYRAILATNEKDALNIIQHLKCDLFLLDFHLPHIDVFELYDRLRASKEYRGIPALFLSAESHDPGHTKLSDIEALLQTILNLLDPASEDSPLN